jgi:hypothetical protein
MLMSGYMTERVANTDGWKTRAKFKFIYKHQLLC